MPSFARLPKVAGARGWTTKATCTARRSSSARSPPAVLLSTCIRNFEPIAATSQWHRRIHRLADVGTKGALVRSCRGYVNSRGRTIEISPAKVPDAITPCYSLCWSSATLRCSVSMSGKSSIMAISLWLRSRKRSRNQPRNTICSVSA
jgi:hypothetical protein